MKKVISILLLFCMLLTSVPSISHAQVQLSEDEEIYLSSNGDGSYTLVPTVDENTKDKNSKIIKVKAVDSEVFKSKSNNKTLIKVKKDTFLEVQEVKIDPLDKKGLEEKIKNYKINKSVADNLRTYIDKVNKKEISNPKEISYFTPLLDINAETLVAAAASTYQGYGGKTYSDSLVRYDHTSNPGEVKAGSSGWGTYFGSTIKEGVNFLLGSATGSAVGATWTISTIFAGIISSNTYPANASFRHMAYLIETKYVKTTSVVEWNSYTGRYDYYVGAVAETSNHYYGNYTVIPGYPYSDTGFTSTTYKNTPNYLNLDYKAYYSYVSSPYVEQLVSFKYQDKYFASY